MKVAALALLVTAMSAANGQTVILYSHADAHISGLAESLRRIADQVEAGETTSVIVAHVTEGSYEFVYGASLCDAVVMSTLMQQSCVDRMRAK